MEDHAYLHSREKYIPLLKRLLSLYDTLSERAGLSRANQAYILGISRQTHANARRRPGGLDAATFLRMYEVNNLLRQALASGDLPVRSKPKRAAQPDILRWFGFDPVEVERAQALSRGRKKSKKDDEPEADSAEPGADADGIAWELPPEDADADAENVEPVDAE